MKKYITSASKLQAADKDNIRQACEYLGVDYPARIRKYKDDGYRLDWHIYDEFDRDRANKYGPRDLISDKLFDGVYYYDFEDRGISYDGSYMDYLKEMNDATQKLFDDMYDKLHIRFMVDPEVIYYPNWSGSDTTSSWPSSDYWNSIEDDESFEDAWSTYLVGPEDAVNTELQIFIEPSIQGGMGGMFIFDDDESGENRFETVEVDYQDWCDKESEMAASSKSAEEYKQKYRNYVESLIG